MKEYIKEAHKVIDSSSAYVLRLIEGYILTLYELGYNDRDIRRGLLSLLDRPVTRTTLLTLKSELSALLERLLDRVDTLSRDATEDRFKRSIPLWWDKTVFISSVIYASTFDKRVDEIATRLITEIDTHIKASYAQGLTLSEARQSFTNWLTQGLKKNVEAEILSAMTALGGVSSLNRLIYLFDDMVNRGFHDANKYYWTQMGVRYKIIIATLDHLTCDECIELHEMIFPIDEDILPVHGYCRCEEYPIND